MNGLDLFSGIGGLALAIEPWVRPIAYCEQDRYCQALLLSRMQRGDLVKAPIWDDVRTLRADHIDEPIDIIYGGFPCQDISSAGNGAGLEGERSGLFFEIIRLCRDIRPRFVFLENVPAITLRGLDRVLLEFTALGFDCRWTIVSAAELGAPHLRERWFLLAHANGERIRQQPQSSAGLKNSTGIEPDSAHTDTAGERRGKARGLRRNQPSQRTCRIREEVANAASLGCERPWGQKPELAENFKSSFWSAEPDVGRVVNGLPQRVDRIRGLGNSVVPLQAQTAFKRLAGLT